jgi:nitronate monooxygenase
MWAGQGAALAKALPAGELIEKMIQEFLAVTTCLQLK